MGIANGVYGALLNIQQRLTTAAEKEEMVAVTYLGAALLSAIVLAFGAKRELGATLKQNKKSLFYLLSSSATVVTAILLLTLLIGRMDNITLLYTFDNSSVLLLSVLCSAVFFKEKMSAMNIVGCATMCASLIVMVQWG